MAVAKMYATTGYHQRTVASVLISELAPQCGAPKIAKLPYKLLNSMVYGRYNKLVFMGFVNQQTYHLRGTILPRDIVLFLGFLGR